MFKNKLKLIFPTILSFSFMPLIAKAVCPVCIVAVASGVGLCRFLGIDDAITGLWVGGLFVSFSFWMKEWLQKKKKDFKFSYYIVLLSLYLMTFIPLHLAKISGHPLNKIYLYKTFGLDKLLLGSIIGSVLVYTSVYINLWLKKRNNNKVFVPFQKVIIPVLLLIIFSIILNYTICRL